MASDLAGRLRDAAQVHDRVGCDRDTGALHREAADALEAAEKRTVQCLRHDPHEPSDVSACWGCYSEAIEAVTEERAHRAVIQGIADDREGTIEGLRVMVDAERALKETALARVPSEAAVGAVRVLFGLAARGESCYSLKQQAIETLRREWPAVAEGRDGGAGWCSDCNGTGAWATSGNERAMCMVCGGSGRAGQVGPEVADLKRMAIRRSLKRTQNALASTAPDPTPKREVGDGE